MERESVGNEENQYVVIGKVLDTYGLRGDLKVEPYLDPKHWQKIKRVFLKHKQKGYVPFNIAMLRPHGNRMLIMHFEGYDSLPQVEGFRGAKVFLPKEEIPKRKKDEYYYFELEGLEVFSQSGKFLGKITGIVEQKPYDLLEIDNGKLYIPFVKALVKEVKLEEGKVIVDESLSEL
ncbi:MAG: ribosome maturation factor RimM [Pyrobaculum arsenaticum]|jgi:16S rRNA processing protein RimM|uniref:ribosome maturation factor RimM n=1 Tax=Pyrobaculum arsenaticum TaxID=121277 RepID=UPI000E9B7D1D|nr:ribosome maturation factor RimM [Pyrobaculum arsenaticum]QWK13776.1 MAG: ribosome maturation factor RimM [Aquificota bacterium]HAV39887.1 16S rRNA processing protein RimM [Aquificaceae bacterium]HCO39278.1 16S rRNA processing protein RimM [Aquificaceae bacterium]